MKHLILAILLTTVAFGAAGFNGESVAKVNIQSTEGVDDYEGMNSISNYSATYGSSSYFTLKAMEAWVNKNNSSDITGLNFHYRIYKQGSTPGSFTTVTGTYQEGNTSEGTTYQKWGNYSLDVNILSGVNSSGTWVFECFYDIPTNGVDCSNPEYLNNSGSNYSFTFTADSSLPVELSSFYAKNSKAGVVLGWSTDSEIENQGFILSRKQSGPWEEIASFTSHKALQGQGSTTELTKYIFKDTQVSEGQTYSYLLSDVDYQGQKTNHDEHVQTITYVIPDTDSKPGKLMLTSLYPNPFNPSISVSYNLEEASDVLMQVYDLKGQLVWQVNKVDQSPGQDLQLNWNGRDLYDTAVSSGVYLISLESKDQRITRKATLLR